MGEAIPLGQAIKATKDLCTSCTETPYRDIHRDNPRGPSGGVTPNNWPPEQRQLLILGYDKAI